MSQARATIWDYVVSSNRGHICALMRWMEPGYLRIACNKATVSAVDYLPLDFHECFSPCHFCSLLLVAEYF